MYNIFFLLKQWTKTMLSYFPLQSKEIAALLLREALQNTTVRPQWLGSCSISHISTRKVLLFKQKAAYIIQRISGKAFPVHQFKVWVFVLSQFCLVNTSPEIDFMFISHEITSTLMNPEHVRLQRCIYFFNMFMAKVKDTCWSYLCVQKFCLKNNSGKMN